MSNHHKQQAASYRLKNGVKYFNAMDCCIEDEMEKDSKAIICQARSEGKKAFRVKIYEGGEWFWRVFVESKEQINF